MIRSDKSDPICCNSIHYDRYPFKITKLAVSTTD